MSAEEDMCQQGRFDTIRHCPPFSRLGEGRSLDSWSHFNLIGHPGDPVSIVKLKASVIPWFICSNVYNYNANEAAGTLFERVFAPNEIGIVTSAGEVQRQVCTPET